MHVDAFAPAVTPQRARKIVDGIGYKVATRHGKTPDGRYKLSFRPFFYGVRVAPFHAGTEPFRGKRLVVAEELKHNMTLDDAMLKRLTGGITATVEDRKIGEGDWFKFLWTAGFLLIFNEGDCIRQKIQGRQRQQLQPYRHNRSVLLLTAASPQQAYNSLNGMAVPRWHPITTSPKSSKLWFCGCCSLFCDCTLPWQTWRETNQT